MWAEEEERSNCVTYNITQNFGQLSSSQSEQCIFRVYDRLKKVNEEAYKPKTICIGPYHRHKRYPNTTLKLMEEHKLRYLENFVWKTNVSVLTLVKAMQDLEESTRNCYAEPINDLDSNEFVEMMLLDSCFIVEFLRKSEDPFLIDKDDPIFKIDHIWNGIIMDLLLLENQLPLFVLDEVFKMINSKDSIIHMAKNVFDCLLPSIELSNVQIPEIQTGEIKHLLGLMHYCWCFPYTEKLSKEKVQDANRCMDPISKLQIELVPTSCCFSIDKTSSSYRPDGDARSMKDKHTKAVTELEKFGIKFKSSNSRTLFDIRFKNGTIQIPPLLVQDGTEAILRSLIAYEQYFPNNNNHSRYFTDYVVFMDDLVNSSKDVETLRHQEIISNYLGEDEVVSKVFNKLCLEINESINFIYSSVCKKVNNHCEQKCNRWMASFRQNYCNSPWALISVLAAVILLLLTVVQTSFSVLSFTEGD